MKTIIAAIVATAFCVTVAMPGVASAANPQHEKMKTCNADAKSKGLKGQERKDFMKSCLSAEGAKADDGKKLTPQQEKMKKCNADAKDKSLKGKERKDFMKSCLSS